MYDNGSYTVYKTKDYPELYLEWVNNFLTVEKFASYYDMTIEQAERIIAYGRKTDNFTKFESISEEKLFV